MRQFQRLLGLPAFLNLRRKRRRPFLDLAFQVFLGSRPFIVQRLDLGCIVDDAEDCILADGLVR